MKFTVIGGAGFIGSHLSEKLLLEGHNVTVFDQPRARFLLDLERAGANIITGDFLKPDDLSKVVKDCDVIYHLVSATVPQTSNDNPGYDVETNVLGTLRLLEIAKNSKVQKVIFASSGGTVYGIPQEIPIKEDHPTDPVSSYGITKLCIEKYIQLYSKLYRMDYCILRISNAYGERQPVSGSQGVIGAFLDKALHDAEITVWGDGSIIRDYIYVGDIVSALIKSAVYEGVPKIFNIGADQGYGLIDIIRIIEKIIQKPLKSKHISGRPFDVPVNILDISRAIKYLNWHPTVKLFEGISRTYEYMLKEQ